MSVQQPSWSIQRSGHKVRVNKMRNRRSRWGPGKVHWVIYSRRWRAYYKACRTPDELTFILGGETSWGNVPKNTKISCQKCLKIAWLNG